MARWNAGVANNQIDEQLWKIWPPESHVQDRLLVYCGNWFIVFWALLREVLRMPSHIVRFFTAALPLGAIPGRYMDLAINSVPQLAMNLGQGVFDSRIPRTQATSNAATGADKFSVVAFNSTDDVLFLTG